MRGSGSGSTIKPPWHARDGVGFHENALACACVVWCNFECLDVFLRDGVAGVVMQSMMVRSIDLPESEFVGVRSIGV
jgi:hypothetical protein